MKGPCNKGACPCIVVYVCLILGVWLKLKFTVSLLYFIPNLALGGKAGVLHSLIFLLTELPTNKTLSRALDLRAKARPIE